MRKRVFSDNPGGGSASQAGEAGAIHRDRFDDIWRRGYMYHEVGLDVSGNAQADLPWIEELLHPWCDSVSPGCASMSIRLTRSDMLTRTLSRQWARHRGKNICFTDLPCIRLDQQTVTLEGWREGNRLVLVDSPAGCFFMVDGSSVELVVPVSSKHARIILLSTIREMIIGRLSGLHALVDLHAAGFCIGGQGVLLAGPRKAGKTTLLCHAITSAGADLLANDRILVHHDEEAYFVSGVPTMASIRKGTLELFPQLLAQDETLGGQAGEALNGSSELRLPPAKFASRLGARQLQKAQLRAILLPEILPDSEGIILKPLTAEEALLRLKLCRYGVPEHREVPTLFGSLISGGNTPVSTEEGMTHLVSEVPVYRCQMGINAYDRPMAPVLNKVLGVEAGSP